MPMAVVCRGGYSTGSPIRGLLENGRLGNLLRELLRADHISFVLVCGEVIMGESIQ